MANDIIARGMASNAAKAAQDALNELSMVVEGTMNAAETEFTDLEGNVVTPDQDTVYQDTNTYVYYRWNGSAYYTVSDPRNVLKYTAQSLTSSEQAQARSNIGAQEALVSGINIKTINGDSLVGSGDLTVGSIPDASEEGQVVVSNAQGKAAWTNIYNVFTDYESGQYLSEHIQNNALTLQDGKYYISYTDADNYKTFSNNRVSGTDNDITASVKGAHIVVKLSSDTIASLDLLPYDSTDSQAFTAYGIADDTPTFVSAYIDADGCVVLTLPSGITAGEVLYTLK